jgi:hypothetical protein
MKLESPERGLRQTAYHILMAGREDLLQPGRADLWDIGRVESLRSDYGRRAADAPALYMGLVPEGQEERVARSGRRSAGGIFAWDVTVPANTSATLSIPTNDAEGIREGRGPASASPGFRFLRLEGGFGVFELEAGVYAFRSPIAAPGEKKLALGSVYGGKIASDRIAGPGVGPAGAHAERADSGCSRSSRDRRRTP